MGEAMMALLTMFIVAVLVSEYVLSKRRGRR